MVAALVRLTRPICLTEGKMNQRLRFYVVQVTNPETAVQRDRGIKNNVNEKAHLRQGASVGSGHLTEELTS